MKQNTEATDVVAREETGKLSDDELCVKVAELLPGANTIYLKPGDGYYWQDPISGFTQSLPNYPADLNAMHEAEKMLNETQRYSYIEAILGKPWHSPWTMLNIETLLSASARLRAEAFVKTLSELGSGIRASQADT